LDKINKFFKNKKILITGNTGFIGSWLTIVLLKHGAKITGISKDTGETNGLFKILKIKNDIHFKLLDLTHEKKTANFLKGKNFDIIIHLAAEPLVYDGYKNPNKVIKNNIFSTINLFNYIKNKKTFLVNFTTDKVYFNDNKRNKYFTENDILYGEDPYSFSKVVTDMMGKMWSHNFKPTKIINVRCGNVIGGADWKQKRLIPDIIKNHYQKKKLDIRNLNSTRPWVHILEVSNILLLLIKKKFNKNFQFDVFNISPNIGGEKNVKWIINYFEKNSKTKLNYALKNIFKEKINLKLSNKKVYNYLKFKKKLSVDKRFELTFDWYNHFFKNKLYIKTKTLEQINEVKKILFSR
jgi:CDP-glucose 4,6-dehydratase